MLMSYTVKYTRLEVGYMGQVVEWPEVITEGKDIEECRAMLRDALTEMVKAYEQLGREIPVANCLIEQVPVEVNNVCQTA
ncbi:MAG: type II toxin-antitoxin system HicB family antitoxin [Desulfobulbaceae bacterium]|nr:type II toxin-antitoxin system HicB family antitoxin [Desulfobulbaceae bacterium]